MSVVRPRRRPGPGSSTSDRARAVQPLLPWSARRTIEPVLRRRCTRPRWGRSRDQAGPPRRLVPRRGVPSPAAPRTCRGKGCSGPWFRQRPPLRQRRFRMSSRASGTSTPGPRQSPIEISASGLELVLGRTLRANNNVISWQSSGARVRAIVGTRPPMFPHLLDPMTPGHMAGPEGVHPRAAGRSATSPPRCLRA